MKNLVFYLIVECSLGHDIKPKSSIFFDIRLVSGARLMAILVIKIVSVHFFSRAWFPCFSILEVSIRIKVSFLFYFPTFSHKGRIAKTTHEGKTRKCTGCDTSIQPGVH